MTTDFVVLTESSVFLQFQGFLARIYDNYNDDDGDSNDA